MTLRLASLAQGRVALTILAVFMFATTAFAQTPPPGGDERPTLTVWGLEFRPRLLLNNIGADNNVKNEAVNPKKDFTIGAQPDLEITARPGPFKVVFLSSTEFLWYKKYKEERMVNRTSAISAELNGNIIRPFFNFTTQNTKARPSPEIDVRAPRHPRSMSGGAHIKLATRTNLMVRWLEARERFEEGDAAVFRGQDLAETMNYTNTTYEGSIGIQLTPLTAFSLVGGREELRFERAPIRNADVLRVQPTLTFNPQGPINGSLAIGYKKLEGLDPALPTYKGLAMNGTISVLLGIRYRLETRVTRDVQYSYEDTLPYYVLTGGRATLAVQLNDLIDLRGTAGQDRMAYKAFFDDGSPGMDRLNVYGGGIGFRIGDRKRFVIQAEFTERDSNRDALRAYKNHRVFGTLTWGA